MSGAVATEPVVRYVDLAAQHRALRDELMAAVEGVLLRGDFILGGDVAAFEAEFAAYCGTRFAVGVANGTDSIVLSLRALGIGPGDEVITAPNSFFASASAVVLAGATPIFVDVRDDYNLDPDLLEAAITPRTRAIQVVHLTGRPADMDPILAVARAHGLAVIEDAAQAVGAEYRGRRVGSFGALGSFSLHPLKNLSACGDAGILTTDDEGLYRYLLKARNHGLRNRDECEFWSLNSRLDTLQAALLRVKLRHLETWTEARRQNAAYYTERLSDVVEIPVDPPHYRSVFHTFVVQADRRDALRDHLQARGVETKVHYPIPIHQQDAAAGLHAGRFPVAEAQAGRIISLPIYPELTEAQRETVVDAVREFYA